MFSTAQGPNNYKQNIQAINLLVYDAHYIIDPNSQFTNIPTSLHIAKSTFAITEHPKTSPDITSLPITVKKYSAFLGILPILNHLFLVFVDQVKYICSIQKHDIFEVASIVFVEKDRKALEKDEKKKAIESYLYYMNSVIFKQGFYFSYTYDLTLSRIKYAEGYQLNLAYCWNSYLSAKLLELKDQSWVLPMIQGCVKTFNSFIQGKKLQYYLIMRRAWKKGGTRYNARGIDEKGNVANFCESEQIVIYNDYLFSHLQIRGSVPLYWKQSGITAKVQFYKEHQFNKTAYKKHFDQLHTTYNNTLCLNLLSKKRLGQHSLTTYFQTLIKQTSLPNVRYEYFDFHLICKGQKFNKSNYLLDKIKDLNESFRFYVQDTINNKVLHRQKGVIRTNCSDCLDRTNYVQTKVAIQIFQLILKQLNINIQETLGYNSLVIALDKKTTTSEKLIINFKNIWADGGDNISILYTGTGSTHTNVTRTGERDLIGIMDHGMKTLGRFYQQNLEDWYKQEVIDLLLGEHTNTINLAEFEAKMKEMKEGKEAQGKRNYSV